MSQTHHGLLIHIVFSTKFRHPYLNEKWRDDLFAYIGATAREHKATVVASGGIEDHVHLLVKIHPSYAIADTVRHLKANSSRWINEGHRVNCRFEWQRGYGAFSVSQSMAATVKQYIRNQRQHHEKQSFRDEYLSMLRNHQVEFDERYVFDEEIVA